MHCLLLFLAAHAVLVLAMVPASPPYQRHRLGPTAAHAHVHHSYLQVTTLILHGGAGGTNLASTSRRHILMAPQQGRLLVGLVGGNHLADSYNLFGRDWCALGDRDDPAAESALVTARPSGTSPSGPRLATASCEAGKRQEAKRDSGAECCDHAEPKRPICCQRRGDCQLPRRDLVSWPLKRMSVVYMRRMRMIDASCSAQWMNMATDTSFHCFLLARARAVRWPVGQR